MLTFSETPPPQWAEHVDGAGRLFHGSQWQGLLARGFGSRSLYAWDAGRGSGLALTVFGAGPFRIAYAGFPEGGFAGAAPASADEALARLTEARWPPDLHLLRLPLSPFGVTAPGTTADNVPETAIVDLQHWSAESRPKLVRDIKKAGRSGGRVVEEPTPALGHDYFRLYRETVSRHHGQMRYTPGYFSGLLALAGQCPRLRCFTALIEERVAGFAAVALDGDTACYLHGGVDPAFRSLGITDLLLARAIAWSREVGMNRFSLMASPPDQPSLVRYKEKWGGETRARPTHELDLRPGWARAFRLASAVRRRLAWPGAGR